MNLSVIKRKVNTMLHTPRIFMKKIQSSPVFKYLPDELALKIQYKNIFLKDLDLENPKTFNEKLQWLKLYNRKPEYTKMVDKYEAKKYVASVIGEEYIIPTYGVWDSFDDIDFDKLPNQFVLKCTHGSGDVIVVKDKTKLDILSAKVKLEKSLKTNYYKISREWPYKDVKPRIIAEKYMEDENTKDLTDYKIYCFNGKCDYVMACIDRFKGETKFIYFDREWNMQKDFSNDGMQYGDFIKVKKPTNIDKMFHFASILSKDIPFVRIDFYECNDKLYFGEITFFPSGGFDGDRLSKVEEYLSYNLNIGG